MRVRLHSRLRGLDLTWRFVGTAIGLGALILIGVNVLVGVIVTRHALREAATDVREFTARALRAELTAEDMQTAMAGARLARFEEFIRNGVLSESVVRVKLWSVDGEVIYSDDHTVIGQTFEIDAELAEALEGHTEAEVSELTASENAAEQAQYSRLVEVYTPVYPPGSDQASGAFEIYRAYDPIAVEIAEMRTTLTVVLAGGLFLLCVALLRVVHGGTRTIRAQSVDLAAREERFRALVVNSSDVLLVLNGAGSITYAGPSIRSRWGLTPAEAEGTDLYARVHADDRQHLLAVVESCRPGEHRMVRFRAIHRAGHWMEIEAVAVNLLDQPAVRGVVLTCRDVTERVRFEQQLVDQALHDPLTSMPNRALFANRVDHALAATRLSGGYTAVMFMDLDRFKVVNDTLGHALGDQLLIAVSRRLERSVRPQDTVARLGGDEFAVVLPGIERVEDAVTVAERILAAVREPIALDGQQRAVSGSIGIALGRAPELDAGRLIRNADVAMYQAKARNHGSYAVFNAEHDAFSEDRLELEASLRGAVERDELRLFFQPSADLRSGRLLAMEALVRWQHPTRGLLQPDTFIPIASETGDIAAIGRWVLRNACAQARLWQDQQPIVMRVNLSAQEFEQPDLVDTVRDVLAETGVDPHLLEIEITETALLRDSPAVLERLHSLKRLGVRLSVDDFGTGYSSLGYLTALPVDALKIDRSFVAALSESGRTGPIVRAIMMVGAAMDLDVTAEGIETPDQLHALQDLDCVDGQGFYFAEPLSAADATALVSSKSMFGLDAPQETAAA